MRSAEDSSQNLTEPPLARPAPTPSATTAPPSEPDAVTIIPPSDATRAEATIRTGGDPHAAGPSIPERLGPYQLLGELGRGGMGVVCRARHTTLGTECAVKVLIAGEHASEESILRFHREAAGVARLGKHPHIVHVFDLGWQGPIAYYAMELIAGRSLRDRLRHLLLDPREAAVLLEKVSRALHFAHEHGLVHRDIKPNNILLRTDGEPQVVDFGLARDLGSVAHISVTGDIMGTPEYMAPEQAGGQVEATDGRTDVYAVGAVLYECLTGIPPHRGSTWPELLEKILAGDVVPPRRLRAAVPRDLETICLKCLEARREARYATAAALIDDLRAVCEARPNQPEAYLLLGEAVFARTIRTITQHEDGFPGLHESIEAFTKALELEPDGTAAFSNRASVWSTMGDEERAAGRSGDEAYQKALADLDEVIRRAPSLGTTCNNRGNLFARMGEAAEEKGADPGEFYRRAEAAYDDAIRLVPGYAPARLNRGHLWTILARGATLRGEDGASLYDRALADYDAALRLQPKSPAALVGRAFLWFDRADTEESAGRDPRPNIRRAIAEYDAAIEAYEAAIQTNPGTGPIWVEWAIARQNLVGELATRGKPFEEECRAAVEAFDEVLRREPEFADGHFRRGRLLLALVKGDDESLAKAEADFAEAVRLLPESAEAHGCLAEAYDRRATFEVQEGKDAIATFERCRVELDEALRLSPSLLWVRVLRSAVLQALVRLRLDRGQDTGDLFERAFADAKEAVRTSPESPVALENLGDAWFGLAKAAARRGEDPREPCGHALEFFAAALHDDRRWKALLERLPKK